MPVVSNTSPILNLAVVGYVDLLRVQFGEVIVPTAVLDELRLESDLPGNEGIRQSIQSGWLKVQAVKDKHLVRMLLLELDKGESAAIALALEIGLPRILIDERDGRAKAKALGLETVGVLGVLLRAKREGRIRPLREAMQRLREEAGFFIADALFQELVLQADE